MRIMQNIVPKEFSGPRAGPFFIFSRERKGERARGGLLCTAWAVEGSGGVNERE